MRATRNSGQARLEGCERTAPLPAAASRLHGLVSARRGASNFGWHDEWSGCVGWCAHGVA